MVAVQLAHRDRSKKLLVVNLGGTSCRYHPLLSDGLSTLASSVKRNTSTQFVCNLSHAAKRTCMAHVAMICNDSEVQPSLPHIILGNEHALSSAVARSVESARPGNVKLWRRKSGWVNRETMKGIGAEIVKGLQPWQQTREVILLLDVCPAHIAPAFVRALGKG